MNHNFQTPGYAAAKLVVDAVVMADDFDYAEARSSALPITNFEVARIAMALYLAHNLKIAVTEKVFRDRFNPDDLQAFLEYYGTRKGQIGYFAGPIGLKALKKAHFSPAGSGQFTAPRLPSIRYDVLRDELTDQALDNRPEAMSAFAAYLDLSKTSLKTVGLSPDLIDVGDILSRAKRKPGWLGHGDSIESTVPLPGTSIVLQFSMNPYEGDKAGEAMAVGLAEAMQHTNEIAIVMQRLDEVVRAHDPAIAPALTVQWTNSYLESGSIYVSAFFDDIDENLNDHVRYHPIGSLIVKDKAPDELHSQLDHPRPGKDLLSALKYGLLQVRKRRKKRLQLRKKIGSDVVLVDPITEHLLELIEPEREGFTELALRGDAPKRSIEHSIVSSVSAGRPVKSNPEKTSRMLSVSFRLKEARLRSRIALNEDTEWAHDRIITRALPESIIQNLQGKEAHEVVSHPFTQYLGKVIRTRIIAGGKTEIQFDLSERAISVPSRPA